MTFPSCRALCCCDCAVRSAGNAVLLVKPIPSRVTLCEGALTDTPMSAKLTCFVPDINQPELSVPNKLLSWKMSKCLWSPGTGVALLCCCFLCPIHGRVWSFQSFSSPHQHRSISLGVNAVTAPSCRKRSLKKHLIPSYSLFY